MSVIQRLHDSEINGAISWPVEGKILVQLGCPLAGEFEAETLAESFAAAERWLHEEALRREPDSAYAQFAKSSGATTPSPRSVVQGLFDSGIAGVASWMFDGVFHVAIGASDHQNAEGAVGSWANAEAWLRRKAIEHYSERAFSARG